MENENYKLEHLNHELVITELEKENGLNQQPSEYYVSEPFDYIFEPDHYPKPSTQTKTDIKQSKKFKQARILREIDGLLEYEYRSLIYNPNLNNLTDVKSLDELDSYYLDLLDYETHLHGFMRGISLSKWPHVGFGFDLSKQIVNNETIFYVCSILTDSPAEFCLQLGDILVELDDMNLSENDSIESINDYLQKKDNIHLMVIHKSKYQRIKRNKEDLLKNSFINCEDIVICNYVDQKMY